MKTLSLICSILLSTVAVSSAFAETAREPASDPNEMKSLPGPIEMPSTLRPPEEEAGSEKRPSLLPGQLNFSAFADFRYSAYSAPHNPDVANAHAQSGFGLEDGAFALSFDQDKLSFTLDLIVHRMTDAEMGGTGEQSSSNRFNVGAQDSLAYVKYKATNELRFDLGQFEGIYGIEANESRDRAFAKQAQVSEIVPQVLTGFMAEYKSHELAAKVFAANPIGRGTYGASPKGDDNTAYGAAVGFESELIQSQIGYMTYPIATADGLNRSNRSLADFTLGLSLGGFKLSGEVNRVDDPSKNTLTPDDSSDHERAGFGYLGILTYQVNEADLVGFRYEKLNDDPTGLSINTADQYGIVMHHRLHKNLDLSTEFSIFDTQKISGETFTDSLFSIGAIVSF